MAEDISLDELVCFDLYAASRAVTGLYRPLLAPLGLTYPQYLVMVVLWRERRASIKQLSASLQLDYGTLTPLLRRMETDGLVTRTRSPEDERSVTIELTSAGKALKRRAKHIPDAICAGLGLPAAEVQRLQASLHRLTANALRAAGGTLSRP